MVITYDELNEVNEKQVTDLLSKREAIDSAIADIQTERATAELGWAAKEQELRAEQNKLTEELRKLRKATLE